MANKNSNAEIKSLLNTIEHLIYQSESFLKRDLAGTKQRLNYLDNDGSIQATVNTDITAD